MVKNPPANVGDVGDEVQSLGQKDPLEEGMETHYGVLAWRIPWTEDPGRLQSMGLQRDETWQLNHNSTEAREGVSCLISKFTGGVTLGEFPIFGSSALNANYSSQAEVKVLITQSRLTLQRLDYSPPVSSANENLQARTLERIAIHFSKGSFQPRDQTWVSQSQANSYRLSHEGSPCQAETMSQSKRKTFHMNE